MPEQHQDILVFNAFTGNWQNASAPGPSGAPLGALIGAPDGSSVGFIPAVGNTISVDGGSPATIASAVQMQSGAGSEQIPGYACALVLNPGAVNEQLGQLTVSGMNAASAQAVLMTSESADATLHGAIRHGTIAPGGSATYTFTTMHTMFPHAQLLQLGIGFNLVTTLPGGSANQSEIWHNLTLGSGWSGTFQYTLVPLGTGGSVMVDYDIGPGTVADGTTIGTMPVAYRPLGTKRVQGSTDGGPKSTGGSTPSIRVLASGDVSVFGVALASSFLIGTGIYPLGT